MTGYALSYTHTLIREERTTRTIHIISITNIQTNTQAHTRSHTCHTHTCHTIHILHISMHKFTCILQ
ncbi:hypothetical protein EON63_09360 [archaeon]|nr:MAG: hypothetical protein EON63_09360 [archaeon]